MTDRADPTARTLARLAERQSSKTSGSTDRMARVMTCSGCDERIVPEDEDGLCPVCRDEITSLTNPDMRVSIFDVMRDSFTRLIDGAPASAPPPAPTDKRDKKS